MYIKGNYVCFESGKMKCRKGVLVVEDGMIADILPYDSGVDHVFELDECDVIYPGLVDLHTHYTYSMLPLWDNHKEFTSWDNRFQWRRSSAYKTEIFDHAEALHDIWKNDLQEDGHLKNGDLLLYLAELQAIAGGSTMVGKSHRLNTPWDCYDYMLYTYYLDEKGEADFQYPCNQKNYMFLRSTDSICEDEDAEDPKEISYELDFYRPDRIYQYCEPYICTAEWNVEHENLEQLEEYLLDVHNGTSNIKAFMLHLSEGRAGYLCPDQHRTDYYTRKEAMAFIEDIERLKKESGITTEDVQKLHINILHGCGFHLEHPDEHRFFARNKIGIIWSPVSDLSLYADTSLFARFIRNDEIMLALGSDWEPCGSKHVWDECKVTAKLLTSYMMDSQKVRSDVFKMVTMNPAKMIGNKKIGNIQKGTYADFFVLRGREKIDGDIVKAMDTFYEVADEGMQLVMIGGRPVYGEQEYLKKCGADMAGCSLVPTECKELATKMVSLPSGWKFDMGEMLGRLDDNLGEKAERQQFRSTEDVIYMKKMLDLEHEFITAKSIIFVDVKDMWTNTKIDVDGGLIIKYRYGACSMKRNSPSLSATGDAEIAGEEYLLPGEHVGCLIGKIDDGDPFYVGEYLELEHKKGRLYLGINGDLEGKYGQKYTIGNGSLCVEIIKKEKRI